MHDYEGLDRAGYCPVCLDVAMRWLDTPVWATDQCEVWECRCPSCGHVERLAETFLIDDDDYVALALSNKTLSWKQVIDRAFAVHGRLMAESNAAREAEYIYNKWYDTEIEEN